MRFWYLSRIRAAKAQASLCKLSPEPSLLAAQSSDVGYSSSQNLTFRSSSQIAVQDDLMQIGY